MSTNSASRRPYDVERINAKITEAIGEIPLEVQRYYQKTHTDLRALFLRKIDNAQFRNAQDVIDETQSRLMREARLEDDGDRQDRVVIKDKNGQIEEFVPTPRFSIASARHQFEDVPKKNQGDRRRDQRDRRSQQAA
ncbi:MAG: hypothetical protein HOO67_01930 [Candidatus Peribacteraceae bacterium]|nr:hypothetical protein [Candidatus Peribacteraceae bacterium]